MAWRSMLLPGLSSFRGSLLGALLGDCLGSIFEGQTRVSIRCLTDFIKEVDKGERLKNVLMYTDDTAMARSVVQSLLANQEFSAEDMAQRFTKEYNLDPDRGYGMAVVHVFEKLDSGEYHSVFLPAKEQFNGKGSYGNGAAMRVVGVPLAYPSLQDIILYAKLSGQLTHASSLGYNGAILQALAVHYAMQGEPSRETILQRLLSHMQEVEADEKSLSDARELELGEYPYCKSLMKIKDFLEKGQVPREDVVKELGGDFNTVGDAKQDTTDNPDRLRSTQPGGIGFLQHNLQLLDPWRILNGNGIAALESVPTAIYSFLRCMDPVEDLPAEFNSLQRTIAYCISLGGDTDTIATMVGAIAGAYHGEEQVPLNWKLSSEAHTDAEVWGEKLHELYSKRLCVYLTK